MKEYKASYHIRGELTSHDTKNYICPNCGSSMRERFMLTFLTDYMNILKPGMRLLHFSPEQMVSDFLKRQQSIEYVTCDIDPSKYPGAIKVDITNIQFADESFDAVVCSHVLEHIEDDRRAMRELHRILKVNGWALIIVPIYGERTFEDPELDFNGRKRMYGIGDHMRMNGLDFALKLSDAGLSVNIHTIDDVPGAYVDRSAKSPHLEADKYLFFCKQ